MNKPAPSPSKSTLALVVVTVVVAVVLLLWQGRRLTEGNPEPLPEVNQQPALTAQQAGELVRMADLANGHVENIELAKADAIYTEIVERLPDEPLGVRNQAICRYLLLEQQKIDSAAVHSSLARLQEIEPNEASTYWLLGKTSAKAGLTEAATAIKHFQRAAELSPENAVYWYEAYDAARVMPDGESQAKQFLGEAYRIAPNNFCLLYTSPSPRD